MVGSGNGVEEAPAVADELGKAVSPVELAPLACAPPRSVDGWRCVLDAVGRFAASCTSTSMRIAVGDCVGGTIRTGVLRESIAARSSTASVGVPGDGAASVGLRSTEVGVTVTGASAVAAGLTSGLDGVPDVVAAGVAVPTISSPSGSVPASSCDCDDGSSDPPSSPAVDQMNQPIAASTAATRTATASPLRSARTISRNRSNLPLGGFETTSGMKSVSSSETIAPPRCLVLAVASFRPAPAERVSSWVPHIGQ